MKTNKNNDVYPVLGFGDDILPSLTNENMKCEVILNGDRYDFRVEMICNNTDIINLVEKGFAEYSCEISCPRTFLRQSFSGSSSILLFSLKVEDVYERIDAYARITVIKDIPEYRNSHQNEDYCNESFHLEPGDTLADFGSFQIFCGIKYDVMYSAGSFIKIFKQNSLDFPFCDIDNDYIKINLPERMHRDFCRLRNNKEFNEIFHASFVVFFLAKALSSYEEEKHGNFQWANAIKFRIGKEPNLSKYDIANHATAFDLAQELLANPFKRMIENTKKQ
jgi:hypothetical protein